MNTSITNSGNSQTKLQQDRQKLKEFYSKQKQIEDDKSLKCQLEIIQVSEKLNTAIQILKSKSESIDNLGKHLDSLYEVYQKIDDQLENHKFKSEIESLLSELI
ncbi:hypothetical protein QEN19_003251 [Hanseniaspora menglaensis]